MTAAVNYAKFFSEEDAVDVDQSESEATPKRAKKQKTESSELASVELVFRL